MNEREQRSSPEIRNRDIQHGGSGCKTDMGSLVRAESSKPAYLFGTCVDDVYQLQSWTNREGGVVLGAKGHNTLHHREKPRVSGDNGGDQVIPPLEP